MFFQTTASNAGEPIETSTIASFDANYSGSKTDEIRILVVWSITHLPVLPSLTMKVPTMIRGRLRCAQ